MNNYILDEADEEGILTTLEGGVWQINPGDISKTILWTPTDALTIEETASQTTFRWVVTNIIRNESVRAMPSPQDEESALNLLSGLV